MATAKRRPLVRKDTFDYYALIIYAARNSSSARELSKALKCRRWFENPPDRYKRRRAFFRGRPYPTVVNWGSTLRPDWGTVASVVARADAAGAYLNPATSVARAINKLETFKCLTEAKVPTPKWTTEPDEVRKWLKKEHSVLARKNLTGAGGAGIHLIVPGGDLPQCGLYVRNYPKTHEFRVHVFDGQVIDFTEKKAKLDDNGNPVVSDRLVRNHDNGWVFAHDGLSVDGAGREAIGRTSMDAVRALGLLFGAVDILAILEPPNLQGVRTLKSAVVCEVNTAPGLENTQTIQAYRDAILRKHRNLRGM